MLDQRAKSWTFGIGITYTGDGKPFVPPENADAQLTEVVSEIEALDEKIASEERDASRYSGGLILAMKQSGIATMGQTRAMLQQKRLSLKYALPQYLPFVKAAEADVGALPDERLVGVIVPWSRTASFLYSPNWSNPRSSRPMAVHIVETGTRSSATTSRTKLLKKSELSPLPHFTVGIS